ncbi:MAG: 6-carboxytetrahydropterin synthase QueD [candidate division NC10 bacterium]
MKLTCDFTFDAAHRILGHSGKCAYLHGHAYRLEVAVSAAELDALGMVIDFDDLRALVKKAVLDRWDHATLLWKEDPLGPAIISAQADAPEKVVALDGQPTAEVLTRLAFAAIREALPAGITLERVAVWESPGCGSALSRGET